MLLVVAKAPVAGWAKTRLSPPYSPRQAAQLAAAALLDTLEAVQMAARLLGSGRPVVALSGLVEHSEQAAEVRTALGSCRVLPQRGDALGERLAAAHRDAAGEGPVLQVGMDTPQLTADDVAACADLLGRGAAVVAPAVDGGGWALGLRRAADAEVLERVAMSRPDTGAATVAALRARGVAAIEGPVLRDVDTAADVAAVAAAAPGSRFARALVVASR